jgi:hypothetical protein
MGLVGHGVAAAWVCAHASCHGTTTPAAARPLNAKNLRRMNPIAFYYFFDPT